MLGGVPPDLKRDEAMERVSVACAAVSWCFGAPWTGVYCITSSQ